MPSPSAPPVALAGGVGAPTNSLRGQQLVSGEESVCSANSSLGAPTAASFLINQTQPNVPAFPPPQGDWGRARVPRGVRRGWVWGAGVGLRPPPIGLCPLLSGSPQSFMSQGDPVLAPAAVRYWATNHLWGVAGGQRGRGESQGCRGIHTGSHGTGQGMISREGAGTEARLPDWPLSPEGRSG